jgi:hypothetical protein
MFFLHMDFPFQTYSGQQQEGSRAGYCNRKIMVEVREGFGIREFFSLSNQREHRTRTTAGSEERSADRSTEKELPSPGLLPGPAQARIDSVLPDR